MNKFKEFQNYCYSVSEQERNSAIIIVKALDKLSKNKQTEVIKSVCDKLKISL